MRKMGARRLFTVEGRGGGRNCESKRGRLERNQSRYVLLRFVQGRRSVMVASTWVPRFRDMATLVPL